MSSNSVKNYHWLPGAMYPAELEWLKTAILLEDVDLLIECGRQDGASARWYHENIPGIEVYSIDLDDRPEILESSKKNLAGTNVKAITGDVFVEVPSIVRNNPTKRIAIVEDAVKGWPGLGLLFSCAFYENVVILAQHNNHIGHQTRELWLNLTEGRAFLESCENSETASSFRKWVSSNNAKGSTFNRESDHSSLAIIRLDKTGRIKLVDDILRLSKEFRHWNPINLRSVHSSGISSLVKANFLKERLLPWTKKVR